MVFLVVVSGSDDDCNDDDNGQYDQHEDNCFYS